MNNNDLLKLNKDRKLCQIAFVCKDIEETMKKWVDYLSVGPWLVLTFDNSSMENFKLNGKEVNEPFKFIVALANVGEMQIELLQPVYGPLSYQQFIDTKGEGLHHIKEQMSEEKINEKTAFFGEKGIQVSQTGLFGGVDIHCIFDTESDLNFIYELGNNPDFDLPEDMYYTYPREQE